MQAVVYDMSKKWSLPAEQVEQSFEQQYISLREREKRICSDEELTRLPFVTREHLHHKEWEMRRQSCLRFVQYLEKRKGPLRILEVGCGNGWLCHRISVICGTFVTGIDINAFELRQAARVFAGVPGLQFVYGSIDAAELANKQFDIILFAASIQYFRSFTDTINQTMRLLKPGGEIHIFDSHFYSMNDLAVAEQRTRQYFDGIGLPSMAGRYYHHCVNELATFDHTYLYKPPKLRNWWGVKKNPFVWVSIRKSEMQ